MNLIKTLRTITNQRLILPFYHAVTDNAPAHLKHLYNVRSVQQFEDDIDFLLKYYTPIDLPTLYNSIKGYTTLPKNSFFLSFDDGLREFKEYALPVLQRKGVPVTIFINSGFINNDTLFFRFKVSILIDFIRKNPENKVIAQISSVIGNTLSSINDIETFIKNTGYNQQSLLDTIAQLLEIDFSKYASVYQPYLTTKEISELSDMGVCIGAHSVDHPLFTDIDENKQLSQISDSLNTITNITKTKINAFSFPFTDYGLGRDFFNKIYTQTIPAVGITFGTAGIKKEKIQTHLQRIPIEDYQTDMYNILRHQYLYYLAKSPFLKNTIRR